VKLIKLTVGYASHLGVGDPVEVDYRTGTPIYIEGMDIEIIVSDGALHVRTLGSTAPIIRPESGNAVEIRCTPLTDWRSTT
jgi:hypothetical protein